VGSFADTFIADLGAEASERARGVSDLEQILVDLVKTSRTAWPRVMVDAEAYVRHLARHLADEVDLERALRTICGPDLYLACACAQGDKEAILALDRGFLGDVDSALARMRLDRSMVDEVKQIVREKLLVTDGGVPKIADYAGRGPLEVWLRVVSVRAAVSLLRARDPIERGSGDTIADEALLRAASSSNDPELDLIRARYAAEFKAALEGALRSLPSKERTTLRLHFVDGLNIDQIGTIFRVHRATVARWIARSREQLLEEVRRVLTTELRLTPTEFQSLMGDVESRLHLSLHRLLESER
jgi:RNA polymerase sigma-70 factor (ECF subfamily)